MARTSTLFALALVIGLLVGCDSNSALHETANPDVAFAKAQYMVTGHIFGQKKADAPDGTVFGVMFSVKGYSDNDVNGFVFRADYHKDELDGTVSELEALCTEGPCPEWRYEDVVCAQDGTNETLTGLGVDCVAPSNTPIVISPVECLTVEGSKARFAGTRDNGHGWGVTIVDGGSGEGVDEVSLINNPGGDPLVICSGNYTANPDQFPVNDIAGEATVH